MKKRFLLLMLVFFFLVNCSVITRIRGNHAPTLDDEYAVYSALINSIYQDASIQTIVIQNTTEVDKEMASSEELQYVQSELKGVTQALVDDFTARNRQVLTFEQRFDLHAKVVILTRAEIQVIFTKGGWDEFYRQYPDSQGTLVLSRVGFNPAVDQSLVYAGNQSHYLAGAGFYYLMVKENAEWKIKQQLMVWIS